jgi:4-amino-4-deoxy-L-arabinose transferase-like glycosyltransferase
MNQPTDASPTILGEPLTLSGESEEQPLLPGWQRWVWGFLAFGVMARSVRYFLRFPLWEDECFLCVSIFKRGFGELLHPLEYHQVAPGMFLWLEKAATMVFGFNEPALRLVPFVCSIASLFLFYHLVSRVLGGMARLFCVAFFAVSYPGIRYAAEAKQYSTDLFASLVLVVLLVEWLHQPTQKKWLAALVLWCPVAIGLSYPSVFTAGAASLILFVVILRHRIRGVWGWWIAYNAAIGVALLATFWFVMRHQMGAELGFMSYCWGDAFPPRSSLVAFVKWFVLTHTGALFAHPAGDDRGGSIVTTLLVVLGMVFFFQRRRKLVPALLLVPLSLHFLAALLQRYPYGGHVKFSMYFAPMVYLFMGVGGAVLVAKQARKKPRDVVARTALIVLAVIGVVGLASVARDLLHPYKTTSDMRARAFAQWFWPSARFEDRAVDIKDDLHREFSQDTWRELSWSAMYLVNKYVYGPERINSQPRPEGISRPAGRVLRCVLYRDPTKDFDQAAFEGWLTSMKAEHPYLGRDVYPFPRMDRRDRRIVTIDYVEIYKFELPSEESGHGP